VDAKERSYSEAPVISSRSFAVNGHLSRNWMSACSNWH